MLSPSFTRTVTLLAATGAVAATLAACSPRSEEPSTTPAPSTSKSTAPTEKNVAPGGKTPGGGNSFTPSVTARPAPTALPGNVITGS